MVTVFLESPPAEPKCRPLTENDAIQIWLARFLRVRPKDLIRRYACDPRRLYEIWEEAKFPGTRDKALKLLAERYPGVENRIDSGRHVRFSTAPDPRQLPLFPEAADAP